MRKLIEFYYKRDNLPHFEFAVRKSLARFLEDDLDVLMDLVDNERQSITL